MNSCGHVSSREESAEEATKANNGEENVEDSDEDTRGPWDNIVCGIAPAVAGKEFIYSSDSLKFENVSTSEDAINHGHAELILDGTSIRIPFHQQGRCLALGNYEGVSWSGLDGQNWIEPNRYFFVSADGGNITDNFTGFIWYEQ